MIKLQYYIVDSTRTENGKAPCFIFETIEGLIVYLEGMCVRGFQKTRSKLMESAADTGLAEDDREGRAFYELMSEYFNIGYVKNNSPARKHIFEARHTERYREEQGD